jgi:1,4-dihydroxy-6-naphthoate synthase
MRLSLAFSPCPNDTFIFEPIVNNKIDVHGIDFDIKMADVEELNKDAMNGLPDITKLSFNAYTKLYKTYQLLNSGSALGSNCGPLLIARQPISLEDIKYKKIAIPGIHTTAYLLLKYAFGNLDKIEETLFSDIENKVLQGDVDAGVIIHENRFTYEQKGLVKVLDLGEFWEQKTGNPIPLGGIAIRRSIDGAIKNQINGILHSSVRYAMEHPKSGIDFIRAHAQEMDEQVMYSHIGLYVNQYTQELGEVGKKAILSLFKSVYPSFNDSEASYLFVK